MCLNFRSSSVQTGPPTDWEFGTPTRTTRASYRQDTERPLIDATKAEQKGARREQVEMWSVERAWPTCRACLPANSAAQSTRPHSRRRAHLAKRRHIARALLCASVQRRPRGARGVAIAIPRSRDRRVRRATDRHDAPAPPSRREISCRRRRPLAAGPAADRSSVRIAFRHHCVAP
jgi:hypothetical protein